MDYYQTTNPSYGMAEASMASEGILFGEIRRRDKVVVFSLTGLTLLMLSACFVYGMVQPKRLINLFFTLCICMMSREILSPNKVSYFGFPFVTNVEDRRAQCQTSEIPDQTQGQT